MIMMMMGRIVVVVVDTGTCATTIIYSISPQSNKAQSMESTAISIVQQSSVGPEFELDAAALKAASVSILFQSPECFRTISRPCLCNFCKSNQSTSAAALPPPPSRYMMRAQYISCPPMGPSSASIKTEDSNISGPLP
jgi:hypothetical protein